VEIKRSLFAIIHLNVHAGGPVLLIPVVYLDFNAHLITKIYTSEVETIFFVLVSLFCQTGLLLRFKINLLHHFFLYILKLDFFTIEGASSTNQKKIFLFYSDTLSEKVHI